MARGSFAGRGFNLQQRLLNKLEAFVRAHCGVFGRRGERIRGCQRLAPAGFVENGLCVMFDVRRPCKFRSYVVTEAADVLHTSYAFQLAFYDKSIRHRQVVHRLAGFRQFRDYVINPPVGIEREILSLQQWQSSVKGSRV